MKFLALFLFITSLMLLAKLFWDRRKASKIAKEQEVKLQQLEEKNSQLSKYEAIVDVDQEIEQRRDAISQIENEAQANANDLIERANQQAEEIAGDALDAKRQAKFYENTAKAIKNTINGYGDEYIIPNRSVLDDLAEEYSYKEGGVELAKSRDISRQMVASGTAALCEYSEKRRKETAIHFVIDAFNGKVDSILSTLKHDNYGKLDQKIQDAFALVNHNGEAFRKARITDKYLAARREELKWAVAVQELRLEEREEQKRIKQEMREEEKARREHEKAVKDAQKEEELLQKAMEKAREDLAAANEEQKEKYEADLARLEQQLIEAEEKSQRTISRAQQTRRGHVYVISNMGSFGEDVFKIGLTRRLEPLDRVRELGDASVPFEFDVHAMILSEDAPKLETELHQRFIQARVNKVNARKEFYRTSLINIKNTVEQMGAEPKWTMKAEAREYHETLALERGAITEEQEVLSQTQGSTQGEDSKEEIVSCPLCGGGIYRSSLQTGRNLCPHCNEEFESE